MFGWLLRRFFMSSLESTVDALTKSPLEEDFGEAGEEDIVVPTAAFQKVLPLTQMARPLHAMFQEIDGLEVSHVTKIGLRLKELPVGKEARFRYQVNDEGTVVELQVTMTKESHDRIGIAFRGSNGIIAIIMRCFAGGTPTAERS